MFLCKSEDGRGESTDRNPIDYSHFGIIFLGLIVIAGGVVTLSKGAFIFGALLVTFGMGYFVMEE